MTLSSTPLAAQPSPRDYLAAEPALKLPPASHWLRVACLIGVDYFSTLAYQVSITFTAAGLLGPPATLVVVGMTLFGALPVYLYLAGRSPNGQSSIALLEHLVRGWLGKTLVLLLLGFAATDFVITKTLSTAAAAQHVIHDENPRLQQAIDRCTLATQQWVATYATPGIAAVFTRQMLVTLALGGLSFLFWAIIRRGFNRKATAYAVIVVVVYLTLNAVVVGSGLVYLLSHPQLIEQWLARIAAGDWHMSGAPLTPAGAGTLLATCLLLFPKVCLGLSGLEMSVVAMPEIKGGRGETAGQLAGRVRDTRRVMVVAALVMSLYLLGSVVVSTLLIPVEQFAAGGQAAGRALAYLAHGGQMADGQAASLVNSWFGGRFGALYDISTVLILCLAGTSVITGLTTLLPQILLKFGMQLHWVHAWGVLFALFAAVNLGVTFMFHASVDDQRGAYATGMLVLITNAALVTLVDRYRAARQSGSRRFPWGYALVAAIFVVTTLDVIIDHPSGLAISLCFIVVILAMSIVSRAVRSNELRTVGLDFADAASRQLWEQLHTLELPVLVPHRPGRQARAEKAAALRSEHQLADEVNLVFIEVQMADPSDFYQKLSMQVLREDHVFVIRIGGCVSVAHAVAAVALELSKGCRPPALHFGWSEMGPLEQAWSFLAFGEGNVPTKVRELIRRAEPDPCRRPRVVVG
jgi:hypothetical protein